MPPKATSSHRRHRTAVHEAGHAILLHHHWLGLRDEHRRDFPPFTTVDVYRGTRRGWEGQVSSGVCGLHLTPWHRLHVDLAGPLAEDGACHTKWVLENPRWWDLSAHEPLDDEHGHSDYAKIRGWMDANGCTDEVLVVAVRETAEILWEKRRLVYEVARRAYRAEYLGYWELLDVLPGMELAETHELRARNEVPVAR